MSSVPRCDHKNPTPHPPLADTIADVTTPADEPDHDAAGPAPERDPSSEAAIQVARDHRTRLFLIAGAIGLTSGALAVLFAWSLFAAEEARRASFARLRDVPFGWAVMPAVGLVVGCFIGVIVQRFSPEAKGSGIPHVKGVLLRLRTMDWRTLVPVKFGAGVLGLGVGLSLGREGPTVQLGAAAGQAIGTLLRAPPRVLPQLISCGSGAGLSAAFNAPLAGFVFVIEELRREMSAITYGAALIAAVCANVVARALTGEMPSFHVPPTPAAPLIALPAVIAIGILGGLGGVLFNQSLLATQRAGRAAARVIPAWTLPGIAAMAAGIVGWWLPDAIGGGHATADHLLSGGAAGTAWTAILVLLVAKLAMTLVSYGSGAPGGIFAPMLVLGAVLGLLSGRATESLAPGLGVHETTFAVLGMAAWFTGSVRAPLTGIVLILEMTGNQDHLFSLCVVCLTAYLTAERLRDTPIYEALLAEDLRLRGGPQTDEHAAPTNVVMSVQTGSVLDGKTLREIPWPPGSLVVGIERHGEDIVPTGASRLRAGDHITVLVPSDAPDAALKIVDLCRVP